MATGRGAASALAFLVVASALAMGCSKASETTTAATTTAAPGTTARKPAANDTEKASTTTSNDRSTRDEGESGDSGGNGSSGSNGSEGNGGAGFTPEQVVQQWDQQALQQGVDPRVAQCVHDGLLRALTGSVSGEQAQAAANLAVQECLQDLQETNVPTPTIYYPTGK